MIKFKKMTTAAKVASGVGVTAVAGVAIIPIINTGVDNPKSKAVYYEYEGTFYKNKSDADAAKAKFTAMSGLVKVMHGDQILDPTIDFKPLMAEFISFVSKLFVVKVFDMDQATKAGDKFKYDGMTEEEKSKLMTQEVAGQIKYGDLKDISSIVKYAQAHKEGNQWLFTPVDEMMLSVIGDGSGQAYSQNELEYAAITNTINKLKANYQSIYKKQIVDNFDGIAYSLVNGVTHHDDIELEMADHLKSTNININEGDGSGDEYTQELITKYQQWGTLKVALENSKNDLDNFKKSIAPSMLPIYEQIVALNAASGWNNKERYSSDEIKLRDLIARVASEESLLSSQLVPGVHQDITVSIIHGWNWSPSGDQSGRNYEQYQLDLAKDIQERERLLSLNLLHPSAPDGAVIGKNFEATGDGSGRDYDQSVFDLKDTLKSVDTSIGDLTSAIDLLVNQGTVAAPDGGELGKDGKHQDAKGLADDVNYHNTWLIYQQYLKLKQTLEDAQKSHDDFDASLKNLMQDITPDAVNPDGSHSNSGVKSEYELIHNIINFNYAQAGENAQKNYNQDQVDLTESMAHRADLEQRIQQIQADGIIPAPPSAKRENAQGRGDESGDFYSDEQIKLRDLQAEYNQIDQDIQTAVAQSITRAKTNGLLSPVIDPKTGLHIHQKLVGLGNDQIYLQYFVDAARQYAVYQSSLSVVNTKIKALQIKYGASNPDKITLAMLEDMHKNGAQEGVNSKVQYTDAEVKVRAAADELQTGQATLKTLNEQLKTLAANVSPEKIKQFQEDYKDGKKPATSINIAPGGDQSGNLYQPDEVAYHNGLEKLKKEFPDGNPWWTGTTPMDSDEAYEALFEDWASAVGNGVEAHNALLTGDGTDHTFEASKLKVFDTFFKEAFVDDMNDKGMLGAQKATDVLASLKTITDWVVKNGALPTNRYVGPTDKYDPTKSTISEGDGSGRTYLDLKEIIQPINVLYLGYFAPNQNGHGTHHVKSLMQQLAEAQAKLNDIKANQDPTALASWKQKRTDAAHANALIIAAREALGEKAAQDLANSLGFPLQDAEFKVMDYTGPGQSLHGIDDKELEYLSTLTDADNQAKSLSSLEASEIAEYANIDNVIAAAQKASDDAATAWSNVVNGIGSTTNHGDYEWYTKHSAIINKILTGENSVGDGDESGNTYTQDQITARDLLNKIKNEIKNGHGYDTPAKQSAELAKVLKFTALSSEGVNEDGSTTGGKLTGDGSGLRYEQWEVDLYPTINALNALISKNNLDINALPPIGAHSGENKKPRGARNGETYSSPDDMRRINVFAPMFKQLSADKAARAQELADAKQRKVDLAKHISDNKLSTTTNLDPKTHFVTPKGDTYTPQQIADAKLWKIEHDKWLQAKKAKNDALDALKIIQDKVKIFDNTHQDEQNKNTADFNAADRMIKTLSKHDALDDATNKFNDISNKLKNGPEHAQVYAWWLKNKGKAVDQTPAGTVVTPVKTGATDFGSQFIADKFEDFIDGTKTGSFLEIYNLFRTGKHNSIISKIDGSVNTKATAKFSKEQFDLHDALFKLFRVPDTLRPVGSEAIAIQAFNTLFMMYKNAIHNGKNPGKGWPKPSGYVEVTASSDKTHGFNKVGSGPQIPFSLYEKGGFASGTKDSLADRQSTMKDFSDWLTSYFHDGTLAQNAKAAGFGVGDFDKKFFTANGNPLTTKEEVEKSDLGKAAKLVHDYTGPKRTFGKGWINGLNAKSSGDGSGKTYSQTDLDYYDKYVEVEKQLEKVKSQQDAVNKFGLGLVWAPSGYSGVTGAVHKESSGDGSGKVYKQETIDDANAYAALLLDKKKYDELIDALKASYDTQAASDPKARTWDEVKTVSPVVEPGNNHQTYWSQAELDYDGKIIKGQDIKRQIDTLSKIKATPDPVGVGVSHVVAGSGQDTIKPAPIHAVSGWNTKPTGTGTGISYKTQQIDKRDNLLILYEELDQTKQLEAQARVKVTAEGATEAPTTILDGWTVPKVWHKTDTGDGTGNTYDNQIFDDRTKLNQLQEAVGEAEWAFNHFIDTTGKTAIDTILDQVARGMVDGVNNEEKYSQSEIALRDHTAQRGDAKNHLNLISGGSGFSIEQLLTPKSIVGPNVAPVGAADGNTYKQEELDLRDLTAKIKKEEADHGIVESARAHVDVFDNTQIDKTKQNTPVDSELSISYFNFLKNIDLKSAIVGGNHIGRGDMSNTYYDQGEIDTFNDITKLDAKVKADQAEIRRLKDLGVVEAPLSGLPVTDAESVAAVGDKSLAGKHKLPVGDETGKIYTQDEIDKANTYVDKRKAFDDATKALADFVKDNYNEVQFFKFKTTGILPGQADEEVWNPIVGRNWADYNFEFAADDADRKALKVGKTMINLDPDKPASVLGVNRGHMGNQGNPDERIVMYKGDDATDLIGTEVLGSDEARIGYVLNRGGTATISDDAPVLTSLEAVARYLQNHPELVTPELMKKFAILGTDALADEKANDKVKEVTVSKDVFRSMQENYKWGDK